MRRRRLALALAAAALATAGCGGGTSSSTSSSSPKTLTAPHTVSGPTTPPSPGAHSASVHPPAGGPVPARFDPVDFTAISAKTFWLLGTAQCSNPVCTSIVRTTDGGAHFVGIPAPQAPLATPNSNATGIAQLRFADALNGWAGPDGRGAPGALWETHDGGAHWRRSLTNVITFAASGGSVYAVTGTCRQSRCSQLGLAHSPASKDNWTATPLDVTAESSPFSLTVHGTAVWVTVSPASTQAPAQTLVSSNDGGRHVTMRRSPCTAGLGGDLAASSANVVWAVCPTGMQAQVWRSADAGGHWTALNTAGRRLVNSAHIAPASDAAAVIATGNQGQLIRTTDGGRTFAQVLPGGSERNWGFLGFTDATTGTGLIIGKVAQGVPDNEPQMTVWRTADGGAHWRGPLAIG